MRPFYYLGWALLIVAFATAAAEVMVPQLVVATSIFISAHELWYTAWPSSLIGTQIWVERLAPFLWDPVLVQILALPGWFLVGLPGVGLVWVSRNKGVADSCARAEIEKYEEAMFVYESLTAPSHIEDEEGDQGAMWPNASDYDVFNEIEDQFAEENNEMFALERAEAVRAKIDAQRAEIRRDGKTQPHTEPEPPAEAR